MTERRVVFLLLLCAACGRPGGELQWVHVPPGAPFSEVADTLSQRGIIKFKPIFTAYARATGNTHVGRPGTYGFRRGESWDHILEDLREGRTLRARFVIPEGWSLDRIAARIATFTESDSTAVLAHLLDSATVARFEVPGPTLEGYLYPATYEFSVDIAIDSLVSRLVARYRQVWTEARRARLDSIGMTEREVITLASIVEKEAKQRAEMPQIASVYHNRLRIGYPLQADPTVQYALGQHRTRLFQGDIRRVDSHPYNTYRIRGLPPGPIASPSDAAIDAVLSPPKTAFLYFVARPDGTHIFTRSLDEHNRAVRAARAAWNAVRSARGDSGDSAAR